MVTADQDRCIGAGQCTMLSPDVFDQGDDGLVLVLDADPPAEATAEVRRAVELCPARALSMS